MFVRIKEKNTVYDIREDTVYDLREDTVYDLREETVDDLERPFARIKSVTCYG